MLRDNDIADFLFYRPKHVDGSIVVQAAPQKQQATVLVIVLNELGYRTREIDLIITVGLIILVLADDTVARRPDITVQFDD